MADAGHRRRGRRLPGDDLDLLQHIRSEVRFESDLLSNRLNAFISSQSFLVIAYASAMKGAFGQWRNGFTLLFPPALALLGLVLSLQARPGIRAAYAVIERWHARQVELFARAPELGAYRSDEAGDGRGGRGRGGSDEQLRQGVRFALHAPGIFGVAWRYLGTAVLVLPHRRLDTAAGDLRFPEGREREKGRALR